MKYSSAQLFLAAGIGPLTVMGAISCSCETSSPSEPPPVQVPINYRAPDYYSFVPAETFRSLPKGPNGEKYLPAPQAIISVSGNTGEALYLLNFNGQWPPKVESLHEPIGEIASSLWSFKQEYSLFAAGTSESGSIATWIAATPDTTIENLLSVTDQHTSIGSQTPVDVVIWRERAWNVGRFARLYSGRPNSSLLADIYSEYAADGYPMLIINNTSPWSCSLTGQFDASAMASETLSTNDVACVVADEQYARLHSRVGLCVQRNTLWGTALEMVESRVARVSEIVLLFNCGDHADGTLDLTLNYRK